VARRLQITKPAIYRYFRGKDELLAAMEEQLLGLFADLGRKLEADAAGHAPAEVVSRFVTDRVRFFASHGPQFFFALNQTGIRQGGAVMQAVAAEVRRLAGSLSRIPGITDAAAAAGYVRSTVAFFLMSAGLDRRPPRAGDAGEAAAEGLARVVHRVCSQGYAGRDEGPPPDLEALERACAVAASEMPPDDPLLSAVAQAVAEHGFAEASIERIAKRAGLTKSSLYFHFRNRGEMFARLVQRHQDRLHELFTARSASCATVSQRLYCFLVVVASYLRQAREIPAVLNWFRYHGYQLGMRHPDPEALERWFAFLGAAVRDGVLRSHGLTPATIGSHLSFVAVNHITLAGRRGVVRAGELRQIHDLFMHGTKGAGS
jgi:AcrR family transcriptional regulator